MTSKFFYLDLEIHSISPDQPELAVQSLLQEVTQQLFGECSGVRADILRASVDRGSARVIIRTRDVYLRKLRAAIALTPRNIRVVAEAPSLQATASITSDMSRRVWETGDGGKDVIMVASKEELSTPSTVTLPPSEPAPGLILPDGSINWGCPCLGGMATGPCGTQFRDAFSCFHYSEADTKGSDCYEKFSVMQECMAQYPELYGKDDDDDELASALEQASEASETTKDKVEASEDVKNNK